MSAVEEETSGQDFLVFTGFRDCARDGRFARSSRTVQPADGMAIRFDYPTLDFSQNVLAGTWFAF